MNKYRIIPNLLIRCLLIIATVLAGIYFYGQGDKLFSIIATLILLFAQIILLTSFIRSVDCELTEYFSTVSFDDSESIDINNNIIKKFSGLDQALQKFKVQVSEIKEDRHVQQVLLHRFLEHVDTGIILFDQKGSIYWLNYTAMKLLDMKRFYSINELWKGYPDLKENFDHINSGERKICKLDNGSDILTLSLRKSVFKREEDILTLIAIDHISNEYSDIEQESWEKLIRVITHEIMNTLTPITALTESLKKDLHQHNHSQESFMQSTERSLNLIEDRSKGLLEFVKKYRKVTLTPEIIRVPVNAAELLYNVRSLFEDRTNVHIEIDVKPIDIEFFVDRDLFSQVIINIIKNAIESYPEESEGKIQISVIRNDNNKVLLSIKDDGPGINKELLSKVFIPFFTTKKEGTGIGLGYSRKIIRLHGGTLEISSVEGEGTFCTIAIP